MSSATISKAVNAWAEANDVHTVTVEDTDCSFSPTGCDVLGNGLGNNVYQGVAHRTDGTSFEVEICHEAYVVVLHGDDE